MNIQLPDNGPSGQRTLRTTDTPDIQQTSGPEVDRDYTMDDIESGTIVDG